MLGMINDFLYKSSDVELKLMTDMEKYLIVKNGICKGMIMVTQQYAKANNLQCPDFESSKLKSQVIYEDMNTLYSNVMTYSIHVYRNLKKDRFREYIKYQSIAFKYTFLIALTFTYIRK